MKTALVVKTRPAVTFMFSNRFTTISLCTIHSSFIGRSVRWRKCSTDDFETAIMHNAL
ncbi:hypothetical protein CY34DRAFT_812036 [Suillus luteus UH-Slu-Lm8-n1]|uniref:Uncharacterized protein n=1 Tax=Suillus luteus UH-Slu-Lm8-n1 TaxID=930992 RepID=A0A0C9ZDH9_9AGAM|nr:hypothetical protein CY34DRAFT_812036 [Suillus luteus UH-Slu-Lm8-n1]